MTTFLIIAGVGAVASLTFTGIYLSKHIDEPEVAQMVASLAHSHY